MSAATRDEQIGAATAYEALFVPALFGPWAPRVADAARIQPADRVLDVACGTGVLTREAASRLRSRGRVAGLDANPGMIAVARQLAPDIEWSEGTAESLPFPDASFDVVVSQFGLMFFSDRRQALREMLRVLTPGGRLGMAVWDAVERMPAYAAEVALLDRTAGGRAAAALGAPFVLGNPQDLTALCVEAGIASPAVTTLRGSAEFPSIRVMVEADLRGWLPVMGVVLTEDQIAGILREAEQALGPYATPDGRASFDVSAHLVTASKPRQEERDR